MTTPNDLVMFLATVALASIGGMAWIIGDAREYRREQAERERKERKCRIAELERELGIGDGT